MEGGLRAWRMVPTWYPPVPKFWPIVVSSLEGCFADPLSGHPSNLLAWQLRSSKMKKSRFLIFCLRYRMLSGGGQANFFNWDGHIVLLNEVIYCPCAKGIHVRLRFWHDILIKVLFLVAHRSLLVRRALPFVIKYNSRMNIDWKLIGEILRFAWKKRKKRTWNWDGCTKQRSSKASTLAANIWITPGDKLMHADIADRDSVMLTFPYCKILTTWSHEIRQGQLVPSSASLP